MAHTPGPWYISHGRQPKIASETDPNGHTIALVYDHCSDETRDANARLIAAALEMRELLQAISETYPYTPHAPIGSIRALLARIDNLD